MLKSKDLAKAVLQECSVIITVGLCYGPSVLKDSCLCCRHVGTSRTTGCARTRARVLCATTPTFTNSYPIPMESTTLEPRVSKPVHVRFFSYYVSDNVNNLGFKNALGLSGLSGLNENRSTYMPDRLSFWVGYNLSSELNSKQCKHKEMIEFRGELMQHCLTFL